jgi:hypothetical protein
MICGQPLEAFFRRQTDSVYGEGDLFEKGRLLHTALLRAIVDTCPADIQRRRASMCLDGTPVVYSLKLKQAPEPSAFRMLVEPGGLSITVPEQIDLSLRTVDGLLHALGWESTVADLNAVIARVFPKEINALSHWWGGIWLGMDLSPNGIELRLYLNLRHGEALARWQRVADVLAWFSDESLAAPLKSLIEQVSVHAIPVGLGVVVSNRIRACRIYAGMYEPKLEAILAASPELRADGAGEVSLFCNSFLKAFGPFTRQSVTLGYDFIFDTDGLLHTNIARTKIDVSCQLLAGGARHLLAPLVKDLLRAWQMDAEPLSIFLKEMRACFHGVSIEYISLGFNRALDHVTVYAKPDGYQSP